MVERFNWTILNSLSLLVSSNQQDQVGEFGTLWNLLEGSGSLSTNVTSGYISESFCRAYKKMLASTAMSFHEEPTQLLQDELFQLRHSINRTSLLRHNESQAVSPHHGLLTLPGTINIYNMGWRLASRAIWPATTMSFD
ncbi:hypothetical protein TNCV_478811 [Trichonephila clavipes]|nr:hypothetical protein TNCV_478811 [Trichonephila clavipes]